MKKFVFTFVFLFVVGCGGSNQSPSSGQGQDAFDASDISQDTGQDATTDMSGPRDTIEGKDSVSDQQPSEIADENEAKTTDAFNDGQSDDTATGDIQGETAASHIVIVHSGPNGHTDQDGQHLIAHGTVFKVTAIPDAGYKFINWSGDISGTSNPLSIKVTKDLDITANFGTKAYTITASAGPHGRITPNGLIKVAEGSSQEFKISPDEGYYIADVLVDGQSVGAVSTYTFKDIDKDHTIEAQFSQRTYKVTVVSGEHGHTDKDGENTVPEGAVFNVTAVPDQGYVFDGWTGDIQSKDNPLSIVVTKDITINAAFVRYYHIINAQAGPHGTIQPGGAVKVPDGGSQDFKIVPDKGYHVKDVQIDGVSIGQRSEYSFANVTADHTITATFEINVYTITVESGPHGHADREGQFQVEFGTPFSVTAIPDDGYKFTGWTGDTNSGANPLVFFVTQDIDVKANFAKKVHYIQASTGPHGSISPFGRVPVADGDSLKFTITPEPGYEIDDVKVDSQSVGAKFTYTFDSVVKDHSIQATFKQKTYKVTVHAGPHGSTDHEGENTVGYGEVLTIKATPDAGYRFVNWSGDTWSTDDPLNLVVTKDMDITANFAKQEYVISSTCTAHGEISPAGAVKVAEGSSITFKFKPNQGYEVKDVIVDGKSVAVANEYTFENISTNHTLRVVFGPLLYTVTVASGEHGHTDHDGANKVAYGDTLVVTAVPDTGYVFTGWSGDMESTTNPLAILVTKDMSIHADFEALRFRITASAGAHGSISPNGVVLAAQGEDQVFTITPDPGYHVKDVMVDGQSVGPVKTYTFKAVQQDHSIQATFEINTYTVTIEAGEHGTTDPTGTITMKYGEVLTVKATPDKDYRLAYWSGDVSGKDNPLSIVVVKDMNLKANFELNYHIITSIAGEHGRIVPNGAVSVLDGKNQSFVMVPDEHYHVKDVKIDSVSVGPRTSYTFEDVSADHTIEAVFEIDKVKVTVNSSDYGHTDKDGVNEVPYGGQITITATPDKGCVFVNWGGDATGSDNPITLTATKDMTVTAQFSPIYHTIHATAGDHGVIEPSGDVQVAEYTDKTFKITPDTGYTVDDVKVDGASVGAVSSYTFKDVKGDHEITASFKQFTVQAPKNLTATDGTSDTDIIVVWDVVAGAEKYELYRSTDPSGAFEKIAEVTSASYTDTDVEFGTIYYYKVKAYDYGVYSDFSNADSGYLKGTLSEPEGVQASQGTYADKVVVSWSAVTGAQGYYVYRSLNADGSYTKIGSSEEATYEDKTAQATTKYFYKVKAYSDVYGESDLSDAARGWMKVNSPQNLKATQDQWNRIEVTWDTVDGATSYKLYRSTKQDTDYEVVYTGTDLKWQMMPQDNTQYYFKVQALNPSFGDSDLAGPAMGYAKLEKYSKLKLIASTSGGSITAVTYSKDGYLYIATGTKVYKTSNWDKGVLDTFGDGTGEPVFTDIKGLGMTHDRLYLIVLDAGRVVKMTTSGEYIDEFDGTNDVSFDNPSDIAVDSAYNIYVADAGNNRIVKLRLNAQDKFEFVKAWGTQGSGDGQFQGPVSVTVSPISGHVFVADKNNNRIEEFTPDGEFIASYTTSTDYDATLAHPVLVRFDGKGNMYIVDDNGLTKFTSDFTRITGLDITPSAIATDPSGWHLYVPALPQVMKLYKKHAFGDSLYHLDTPGTFVASQGTGTKISTSWQQVGSASKYVVFTKDSAGNDYPLARTGQASAQIAVDCAPTMWVEAYDQDLGYSKPSNTAKGWAQGNQDKTCTFPYFVKDWGTTSSEPGQAVAVGPAGNVYITGNTMGSFGGTNKGNRDVYLMKLDEDGDVVWKRQWGTSSYDYGQGIAVDKNGNVYVTGYTGGALSGSNAGNYDVFLIKVDTEGNTKWIKQWGTSSDDYGQGIAVDKDGNVFVSGYTSSSFMGTYYGGYDAFVFKVSPAGAKLWGKQWGNSYGDYAYTVAVDSKGNVFVPWYYSYSSGWYSSTYYFYAHIRKYTSTGSPHSNYTLSSTSNSSTTHYAYPMAISIDGSDNLYVTGNTNWAFAGTYHGHDDVFAVKLKNSGSLLWKKQWGTSSYDDGMGIAVSQDGTVVITGYTAGAMAGTNKGSNDVFMIKTASTGNTLETKQWGSPNSDEGLGVAIDSGLFYITGYANGSIDGTDYQGSSDILLIKRGL